ncbi:YpmS family protein [Bacillus sp. FJAT-45066]|uniref:YpmS family protein n=1 Tax=Bacillus sp. FJAT-45066 TaxID=2011010 RepID=UPI000BB91091|nr:YpmS family protein [Bacillus sp. FJAT-45066]
MLQRIKSWKSSFFILLIVNIIIALTVSFLIFLPNGNKIMFNKNEDERKRVGFTIQSNKEDLNDLIDYYLKRETKRPLNYDVTLTDRVELRGEITVFERNIPLTMTFVPEVQENGDVILNQDSMSIGRLQVPVAMVLKYVADNYPLPEWVTISPSEQLIYVGITELKLQGDTKVKLVNFDLEKDDLVFRLYVPVE